MERLDIEQITEVYDRVARLLTKNKNLTVQFVAGKESFYDCKKYRIVLGLPPMYAESKEQADKYLFTTAAHEIGHAIWTEGTKSPDIYINHIENAMEDERINKKIFIRFPGVVKTAKEIDRDILKKIGELDNLTRDGKFLCYLWAGKEDMEDLLDFIPDKIKSDVETILAKTKSENFTDFPSTKKVTEKAVEVYVEAKKAGYFDGEKKKETQPKGGGKSKEEGQDKENKPKGNKPSPEEEQLERQREAEEQHAEKVKRQKKLEEFQREMEKVERIKNQVQGKETGHSYKEIHEETYHAVDIVVKVR